ncbi:hypothetical protein M8013_22265 [Enterobacteriaceae bacterium H4N4]|uniref:Uncharacterized protein n=1 Tax=Silvania confinis TaxID=2926470 RepID=A0A9J6QKS7_9ENTR|nr:hypothetical protein [Silvania confinis]MCU6671449.1 hypothetical protein [Silvania confinis]
MATIPTLLHSKSDESVVDHLIARPLPESADRFEVADNCTALVCVLIETDDSATRAVLCDRLLHALGQLRALCDTELPPALIAQLIEGEKLTSSVPDCWQETSVQLDYAMALTQAIAGGTLPAEVAKALTGLLHDMVWLLAEYVKEPYISAH